MSCCRSEGTVLCLRPAGLGTFAGAALGLLRRSGPPTDRWQAAAPRPE